MLKPGIISDAVAPLPENDGEHNSQTLTDVLTENHELLQDNERDQDSDTENEESAELFSIRALVNMYVVCICTKIVLVAST